MPKATVLLAAVLILASCATSPRMTPAERLAFYQANAGETVRGFAHPRTTLWGWRSLGDSAVAVWPRSDQGFLLELTTRCPGLIGATSIDLTNRAGRVSAGFDSVIVRNSMRTDSAGRFNCRIQTIRPINTRVVKELKSDLGEVGSTERDPSIPDEPEQ
jgi:hypothetical protein